MRTLAQKAKVQEAVDEKFPEVKAEASPRQANVRDELVPADDSLSMLSRSSLERTETAYDANPFDVDHVNTQNSAIARRSHSTKARRSWLSGFWRK